VRRAARLDEDTVAGDAGLQPLAFRLDRIRVDVEMREVAAGKVETKPVASVSQPSSASLRYFVKRPSER